MYKDTRSYSLIRTLILASASLAIVGVLFAVYQSMTGPPPSRSPEAARREAAPAHATPGSPETPKGVADYFVEGVTTRWQRFELPFPEFKPRTKGAQVDWSGIKLMAVALIDPYDPLSGTLQVDNLQALPAGAG